MEEVKSRRYAKAYVTSANAFWLLLAVLVILIPTLICNATPETRHLDWPVALFLTTLSGARLAWMIAAGKRRLIDFTFWLFAYVFFGLAPLVQLRTGVFPETTPNVSQQYLPQGLVALAATTAFYLFGSWAASLRGTSNQTRSLSRARVSASRTAALAIVACGAGVLYSLKIGFGPLFSSRIALEETAAALWPDPVSRAIIRAGVTMTLLVSFVALVHLRRAESRRTSILLIATGIVLLITVNPISSPRYVFGTVGLATLATLGAYATPKRFSAVAGALIAALLLLFPMADAFRYGPQAEFKANGPLEALTSPDFDAYAQITNTFVYLDRHGSTDGRQAAGVVLFWIPRSVWIDKPEDTGILLARDRGYSFKNLSAPLPTELLINGSWSLLAIGMTAFGWVARRCDELILKGLQEWGAPGILGCILPAYLFIILRGSLLQAMAYLVVIGGAAFVVRSGTTRSSESRPGDDLDPDKSRTYMQPTGPKAE